MDIDAIYKELGDPGRFHVLVYALLFLDWVPVNNNHLIMTFYGAVPAHHCKVPDGMLVNETIPRSGDEESLDKCLMYYNTSADYHSNVSLIKCVDGWTYYTQPGEVTIVTEWNLVCNHAYLANLATTIYFAGVMVGGIVFGALADYYGRRPMLLITLYIPIGLGASLYFVHNYVVFVVIRFIMGAFLQGLEISSFVLVMELFQPRQRTVAGCVIMLSYAFGNMWISLLSHLLKNWHYIQLAISLPTLLMLCQIWIVPESPRWLLANRRFPELRAICRRIAKFNKKDLPEQLLTEQKAVLLQHEKEIEVTESRSKTYTLVDLFRTPRLRKRSAILFFIWFVMNLGYYGLSFNISALAGNKYLNFFIGALIEVPAYGVASVTTLKLGRRRPLCAYLVIGGVSCILSGSIPSVTHEGTNIEWLRTSFALLGRFGMASVVCVMFLYTSELFPTVVRNIGVGCCAFFTRFGGVVAPQILNLRYVTYQEIPVIMIGCLALVAASISLFLPETMGRHLPDTIEDAESFGIHSNMGKDREEIVIEESAQSML